METLNFDELYNKEIKKQFIVDITNNNDSRKTFFYMFLKTAQVEKEKKKDLFDMVRGELEEVFHTLRARTKTSAANYISNIYKYIDWCSENGYRPSNLDDFAGNVRGEYAEQFVSKSLTSYYTRDELFESFKDMDYVGDQALLLCVFEGIRGKANSEIANLKVEHLKEKDNKYYVELEERDDKDFEISKDLFNMLIALADIEHYTDKRGVETYLMETPYIFRRSKSGRKPTSEKINSSFIMNKTVYYKKVLENKSFHLRDIELSGMMFYLNEWLNESGERKITNDLLERAAEKYNIGIYTHSLTKEKTYSYSKIRDLINDKFFTENYGKFEYVN